MKLSYGPIVLLGLMQSLNALDITQNARFQQAAKTRTVTEILTVTRVAIPDEILVTQTVFSTVEALSTPQPAPERVIPTPELVPQPAQSETEQDYEEEGIDDESAEDDGADYEDNVVITPGDEKAQFGFDVDYFARRYGKIPDAAGKLEDSKVETPEVYDSNPNMQEGVLAKLKDHDSVDFHRLNEKHEGAGSISEPIDGEVPEGVFSEASPYHLELGYDGKTNPYELSKPNPHKTVEYTFDDGFNIGDVVPDENSIYEKVDEDEEDDEYEEEEYVETNERDAGPDHFGKPKKNEKGNPIPQENGIYDDEELSESQRRKLTKGKQIIDPEDQNKAPNGSESFDGSNTNATESGNSTSSGIKGFFKSRNNPFSNSKGDEENEAAKELVHVAYTLSLTVFVCLCVLM